MDSITQVLLDWESEGVIVLLILAGSGLFYYFSRIWRDRHLSFNILLGISLAAVATALYFISTHWHFNISQHTLLFILIYVWCALWMCFFARHVHRFKLLFALVLQASIIYALYRYV